MLRAAPAKPILIVRDRAVLLCVTARSLNGPAHAKKGGFGRSVPEMFGVVLAT